MTQPNMRRLLKQPHISLRDGGEVSPWSLRGIIKNVQSAVTPTPPTPEQAQRAKDLADYKARAEAARNAPAPAAAAPAQAAAPALTQYGNGDITAQRMKAAGLRDGGDLKFSPSASRGHQPRRPPDRCPWRRRETTTSSCGDRASACDTRWCRPAAPAS